MSCVYREIEGFSFLGVESSDLNAALNYLESTTFSQKQAQNPEHSSGSSKPRMRAATVSQTKELYSCILFLKVAVLEL